ncbi:hypothetical protein [Nocardioides sp. AE5]|uniref:hypothetical protein n=1 Tax=Nocardioides sp. AE5 TaxID=2962573 RepID=UPI002882BF78|nr:hypothetical protein [Nocardioides sp. AE5]MDT0202295.1 hypothetical protein [Nocardioides sp. AE5]
MSIHRRAMTATALAAAALLTFAGCASQDEGQVRPGVAATVGETEFSIAEVDERAPDLCDYAVATGEVQEAIPMGSLRISYLQLLIDEELARAYVAEQGRQSDPTLRQMLAANEENARQSLEQVPPAAREVYLELVERTGYIGTVQQLGGAEYAEWAEEQEVVVDPRFMAVQIPGSIQAADLSVAVSTPALLRNDNQDPEKFHAYLDSLPDSQKCSA